MTPTQTNYHIQSIMPDGVVERLTFTIEDACKFSGYSRSELYRRLSIGEIEAVKIGRATRVLAGSLKSSIAGLPRAEFRGPKTATHKTGSGITPEVP